MTLKEIERAAILSALRKCNGSQKKAAVLLGVSPRVINYRMRVRGIKRPMRGRNQ